MVPADHRRCHAGRSLRLGALALVFGCQPSIQAPRAPAREPGTRDTRVVHEACDVTGSAERFDANDDGIPELSRSHKRGRAVCEAFDLNQDGVVDVWAYYDGAGRVRRRELAYGRDARITEIRVYTGGQLSQIQQATGVAGKLDTWQLFARGKRLQTQRDSNGDGKIDEWWEYPDPNKPGCPLMYRDLDDDGKPDRKDGVDLCASGYVPPDRRALRPTSPRFEREEALPQEVDKGNDEGGSASPPEAPTNVGREGADALKK